MTLEWLPTMSVGDPTIDEDHKKLIAYIGLYEESVAEHDLKKLKRTFEALRAYTHEHFEREEKLMAAIHYVGLNAHREAHDKLREKIRKIHEGIMENRQNVIDVNDLNKLLYSWIIDHIFDEDFKYKPLLTGKKL